MNQKDRDETYMTDIDSKVSALTRACRKAGFPVLVVVQTDGRTDADEDTLVITASLPDNSAAHLLHAYSVLPRDAHAPVTTKTIDGKVAAVETHE